MAELVIRNLEKRYGDVIAVRGVSLKAGTGEFVVLVGPSGCGKSTLLRSIAGLEDASAGTLLLGGRELQNLAPRDRNIAMVFQTYALYPYLTAYENIAFGLRARKVPAADIDRLVKWAADLLHIADYLDRYPRELSGGQRQRVAIGRAIVRDADLYLFDEPLSNLDANLRDGMREEIKLLHRRLGKTFIYVTHDQIEAMTLADRIVLLRDGEVVQQGAPLDLFERPVDMFVAGFLGSPSMNFIEVEIPAGESRLVLPDGQAIAFDRSAPSTRDLSSGACIWGVRPEHFSLSASVANCISATIKVVQPTGSRTYCSFSLSGNHIVAELEAHACAATDQKIQLSVAMDRTVFFDSGTGLSLAAQGGSK